MIRTPKWAYFKRFDTDVTGFQDELFDVELDPGETTDLAADPAFAAIKAALDEELTIFFDVYAEERADPWKGGLPIQHSECIALWRTAWKPVFSFDQP